MIKLYEEIENGYFDEIDRNRAAELIQSGNGHLVFNHRYMNLQQERNNYKELYEKEKDLVNTILTFNLFGDECPLNFGFENGSPQEKAQRLFYEDDGEFCENNCDDCYKKCWLKFFNRIQEIERL